MPASTAGSPNIGGLDEKSERPPFSSLPLSARDPPFSAWGLYGPDDDLGTLNLLTAERVAQAAKEIRTGIRVGLNLPLSTPGPPSHNRKGFSHKIIHKAPRAVHDDEIDMNTQCSTQWDGYRHYGYQNEQVYYGGVKNEQISGASAGPRLGIDTWCVQGIAARGVLLDYFSYAKDLGISYDLLSNHVIPLKDLQACAQKQSVKFLVGDILLIRTGWTKGYQALDQDGRQQWASRSPPLLGGIETTKDMVKWIWDTGFSAVAADGVALESLPWPKDGDPGGLEKISLHEVLLGGWGMPIGEMWDLEELSRECARQRRYSFFLTSMPLNIPGGIAGPANALAIF